MKSSKLVYSLLLTALTIEAVPAVAQVEEFLEKEVSAVPQEQDPVAEEISRHGFSTWAAMAASIGTPKSPPLAPGHTPVRFYLICYDAQGWTPVYDFAPGDFPDRICRIKRNAERGNCSIPYFTIGDDRTGQSFLMDDYCPVSQ